MRNVESAGLNRRRRKQPVFGRDERSYYRGHRGRNERQRERTYNEAVQLFIESIGPLGRGERVDADVEASDGNSGLQLVEGLEWKARNIGNAGEWKRSLRQIVSCSSFRCCFLFHLSKTSAPVTKAKCISSRLRPPAKTECHQPAARSFDANETLRVDS